ncbi:MAG: ribonucleotide-diphosphate reductase subunit beta [Flavobacteriales bacterium]|jgi:ribonucleoside-diphosphate reductase beta chain|nr:ribonucleotide-diphosphate reductase subunit beta [Flavobacteriales bacterium]
MKNIFQKRVAYKPFEYPEVLDFINPINQTFWVHSEVDFTGDVQDFKVDFAAHEKNAVKRTLLAIAQVEVAVKTFWGNLYNHLPKPEFNGLGSTFAECEFRHSEAYSRLLDVLGFNDEFESALESEILQERLAFLQNKDLAKGCENEQHAFALNLVIFSLLVENVSLFSQFATILSFTHFKGSLKNTSNIIAWTSKDEQLHANAGIYIFNAIMKENPQWFSEDFKNLIYDTAKESIEQEKKILNWIFEEGSLEHLSKEQLLNFMKNRINISLKEINLEPVFDIDEKLLSEMKWFDEEVTANTLDDFFAKRPVEYSKHNQAFTADDLF